MRVSHREREREREREGGREGASERERERERQTDRQTDRQRQRCVMNTCPTNTLRDNWTSDRPFCRVDEWAVEVEGKEIYI